MQETEPESQAEPSPLTRREARAQSAASAVVRPPAKLSITGVLGELLITAGVIVMLFLGWYIWLNDVVTGGEQQQAAEVVQQELQDQYDRGEASAERPTDPGEPGWRWTLWRSCGRCWPTGWR